MTIDKTIILCDDRCPYCGQHLIKRPYCGGDYYPTVNGYILQRYCDNPDCGNHGVLYPYVEGADPYYVSNNMLRSLYKKIAIINHMGFEEVKKIVMASDSNNLFDVARYVSDHIRSVSYDECINLLR